MKENKITLIALRNMLNNYKIINSTVLLHEGDNLVTKVPMLGIALEEHNDQRGTLYMFMDSYPYTNIAYDTVNMNKLNTYLLKPMYAANWGAFTVPVVPGTDTEDQEIIGDPNAYHIRLSIVKEQQKFTKEEFSLGGSMNMAIIKINLLDNVDVVLLLMDKANSGSNWLMTSSQLQNGFSKRDYQGLSELLDYQLMDYLVGYQVITKVPQTSQEAVNTLVSSSLQSVSLKGEHFSFSFLNATLTLITSNINSARVYLAGGEKAQDTNHKVLAFDLKNNGTLNLLF